MTKYITHFTNHVETANNYLMQQYKDRPNIKALVSSLVEPLQVIEDTTYDLYIKYYLPVATGYHLDRLGAIMQVARKARSDDEFRYAINIAISARSSGGTAVELIEILKNVYIADKIEYLESGSAYFSIFVQSDNIPVGINQLLMNLKPAGVSIPSVIYANNSNIFRLAEKVTENVPSVVRSGIGRDEYDMEVQDISSTTSDLELSYDSFKPLDTTLGFGEIIINKPDLVLNDDSNYLVDNIDELQMLLDYGDYKVEGGSRLAEIVSN